MYNGNIGITFQDKTLILLMQEIHMHHSNSCHFQRISKVCSHLSGLIEFDILKFKKTGLRGSVFFPAPYVALPSPFSWD